MTPHQLRGALGHLHWSQRGLAEMLNCDDRLVRRWISGELAVPPDVGEWLQELADLHESLPPPAAWRRRATSGKAAGADMMPVDQTTTISNVSWDWQPGGKATAKGMMTVSRGGTDAPAITLQFEIPLNQMPPRAVLADPRAWILSRVRQALGSGRRPKAARQAAAAERPT